MQLVIAAGCPGSGWELVCPVLNKIGLNSADDGLVHWLDGLFPGNYQQPDGIVTDVHPQPAMVETIKEIVVNSGDGPLLLADSRNIRILDFWAGEFPQAVFLFFYTGAELSIAHAVYKGYEPWNFVETWQDANGRLLEFQRRHRKNALLFDAYRVLTNPQALVPICDRIGLALRKPESAIHDSPPPLLPLERLMAAHCVASQPSVQLLESELEASAFPLGNFHSDARLKPEEVFADYVQRRAKEQTLVQIIDERDVAIEKLKKEYSAHLEKLEDACRNEKADNEKARHEAELVLKQLHQVQEELEAVFLQKHRLESDQRRIELLQKDLQDKEKKIGDQDRFLIMVKESTFWKISAPIRGIFRFFKRGKRARVKAQINLIKSSGYFNADWYLSQYPDVKKEGMDPIAHYLYFGAAEGRDPSPNFKSLNYLKLNPDVEESGMNPLVHCIQFGRAEGRNIGSE